MDTVEGLFDVSDEHKRDLLEALQVLSALQGDSPSLDELLVAARINCISKVGTAACGGAAGASLAVAFGG